MNTDMHPELTPLVPVMVPRERLAEVYALLGDQAVATHPIREEPVEAVNSDVQQYFRPPESKDWPEGLPQRAYRESSPAMKAVLDVLIDNAGRIVHSRELIDALSEHEGRKCDHHSLAGTIGAFGRRVKNRYRRDDWPMYSFWDGAAGECLYRLSPEVAEKMRS